MTDSEVHLNIVEVRKPEIDANLVADNIAQQLERRMSFPPGHEAGGSVSHAHGCRRYPYQLLRVVLAVLKSLVRNGIAKAACRFIHCALTIDYGVATAHTAYGTIGIKVWIFKGEILEHDPMAQDKRSAKQEGGGPAAPCRDDGALTRIR